MKIVIVLYSLATIAIAVPVYQENVFESSLSNQPSPKREKKTALPEIPVLSEYGIENNPIHNGKKSAHGTAVEAKSFRKPIIIKRKFAYHVYRDSDEEMANAEPGEKCREQVKFKLCDHEPELSSNNGIKSPTFICGDSHKTDNEMRNSIKMTKEAVEHLQRNLKRKEILSPKMVNPQIEDIESNAGLYHDIEIAREAIEHIEENFKSVSPEENKVNELQISKTQGEERLTRWREAIENIHKNIEIVKNIEDALKSDNQYSIILSNSRKADQSEVLEHYDHDKYVNDNFKTKEDVYSPDIKLKSALNTVEINQLTPVAENVVNIGRDAENDMFISPNDKRDESMQLHSDSLKSEIDSKDTSLRSTVDEVVSPDHDSIVPSIKFSPKNSNSLSEVLEYSEHGNNMNGHHTSDDNELFRKVASGSTDSLYEDVKIEEQKANDQSQLIIKTALPDREIEDEAQKFKIVLEYNDESKENQGKATSRMIQNQETKKFSLPNPEAFKEAISTDSDQLIIKQSLEEQMRMSLTQNKDDNEVHKWQSPKSVPKLQIDLTESTPTSMRSSENQVKQSNENQKILEISPIDDRTWLYSKSAVESQTDLTELFPKDKVEISNDQQLLRKQQQQTSSDTAGITDDLHSDKVEASLRSSEKQFQKTHSNQNQEDSEYFPTRLKNENHQEENILQFLKSVPEIQSGPTGSLSTDKVKITNNQHFIGEEASMRLSEYQNDKMQINLNQKASELLPLRLESENRQEEGISQLSKSVPELQSDIIKSLPINKVDLTDDQKSYREELSMRSSQNQEEQIQLNKNQEAQERLPMSLDTERHSEERLWQLSKSAPELYYDPKVSNPLNPADINDDQNFRKGEASMRSSENQNDKVESNEKHEMRETLPKSFDIDKSPEDFSNSIPLVQNDLKESVLKDKVDTNNAEHSDTEELSMRSSENQNEKIRFNKNQESQEYLPVSLDIERHPEESLWQVPKSVLELSYDPKVSNPLNPADIVDDQYFHKGEASMRSSETQNDKVESNENHEMRETLPKSSDIDNSSEDFSKSVPELQNHFTESLLKDKVDTNNAEHSETEKLRMRASENQNEKIHSNANQETQEHLPVSLDIERRPEERLWQLPKSVSELSYDSKISNPLNAFNIANDQYFQKGEASMRSSENQNDKMDSNENHEMRETLPKSSDIDNTSEDFSKSVPELQNYLTESLLKDKADTNNAEHSHKEELSMRSSENQNEKIRFNENQEAQEHLPMSLDVERHSEERLWQLPKSAPELYYDPKVSNPLSPADITDDQNFRKGEASMRSSENQNDKVESNEKHEMREPLPKSFDIDKSPEDFSSSIPLVQNDLKESVLKDKVDTNNAEHSDTEELSMRSSENQNEKIRFNKNQESHEYLPVSLDIERHPEESLWQVPKSVLELSYDPKVSNPLNPADIVDDQYFRKGEASMRSSENQNDKVESNENHEMRETLLKSSDIDKSPEDFTNSIPLVQNDLKESVLKDKVDTNNAEHSDTEELSMRSSENQNEKIRFNKNQESHEYLPESLDIERHPEESLWQVPKSVLELSYDPKVSNPLNPADIVDDQYFRKGEASMRSSENQNDKVESNEKHEMRETLLKSSDIDKSPEDFSNSIPLVQNDLKESVLKDKVDTNNAEHSDTEELSMKSSENQNEKIRFNKNQESQEYLPVSLDIERHPEESLWQVPKSVLELSYDPKVSNPLNPADIVDDQYFHKGEASMRSSETQNDKVESNENHEMSETLPKSFGIDKSLEDFSKSVPELKNYLTESLLEDKVDTNKAELSHTEELSMRSSENQNEKIHFNENQEVQEHLPLSLDIERHPEERLWQLPKSVPELYYDPKVSNPLNPADIADDQNFLKEASMRSSENQFANKLSTENAKELEAFSSILNIENQPEGRTWQSTKSVLESNSDPMLSKPINTVSVIDNQYSPKFEASRRSSENQYEKDRSYGNQDMQERIPITIDMEGDETELLRQFSKSVDEVPYDSMASKPTNTTHVIADKHSRNPEASMGLSDKQNKQTQFNEHEGIYETLPKSINIENYHEQPSRSISEMQSDLKESLPKDKVDISYDQHPVKEDTSIRSSQNQNDLERQPEELSLLFSKSVSELFLDPKVSVPTNTADFTTDQNSHKVETSKKSSEDQNEKWLLNLNNELHEPLPTRLGNDNHPEDRSWQLFKSVPEVNSDPIVSMLTNTADITDDQYFNKIEASTRSSEKQFEKILLNENSKDSEPFSTRLDTEKNQEERLMQFLKSVPEVLSDLTKSLPTDKIDTTNDQHFSGEETSRRSSENLNEKIETNEYQVVQEYWPKGINSERHLEKSSWQLPKSVDELPYDPNTLISTSADITDDQHSHIEEARMRSPENQFEKMLLNENRKVHETLPMRLDIQNNPEDRSWQFTKSVPELNLVSMPTDKVEITNKHYYINEDNMRLSQNQNERFDETYVPHELFPTKQENYPLQSRTSQFFKTADDLYKASSDINNLSKEKLFFDKYASLSQNENAKENKNLDRNLYESLSSRSDTQKYLGDDSSQLFRSVQGLQSEDMLPMSANKLRLSYTQNPIKEQAFMRLAKNQNELQYPKTSLDDPVNMEDNAKHIGNDIMQMRLAQHQQQQENRDPMLGSLNERQHISHNIKSSPEYKMLSPASQFDFSNNEYLNMRENQQKSIDQEPVENQNLPNFPSMRWNTEHQYRDPSPNSFQSISDFDHTLHRSRELDNEHTGPQNADRVLENEHSSRWFPTRQHNGNMLNYYKTIPEAYEDYVNPHYRNQLRRVAVNHRINNGDAFSSIDIPSSRARLHNHMQIYHNEKTSSIDGSVEPSIHMDMREPFVKSGAELNNMHFNHPHGTARFGAALPIAGVNSGAVGVFPTANAGGCGIPLLLSCSPSVVSGSLARPHIAGPIFKSADENYKYFMKRNVKNIGDVPVINVQKASLPSKHETVAASEIKNNGKM